MRIQHLILFIYIITIASAIIYTSDTDNSIKFVTGSGKSMEPTITSADVIIVTHANPEDLDVGDIIVYEYEKAEMPGIITHRIVEIVDDNNFRTKGDANDVVDDHVVKHSEIVGVVWFTIPYLASFSRFVNTGSGYVLSILLPAIMIVTIEIKRIIRYKRS